MSLTTPRIQPQHLESFTGRTVRLIGKVVQLRGDSCFLEAGPGAVNGVVNGAAGGGGMVECLLSRDCHLQTNHAVEIVGRVTSDLKLKVLNSTDFGQGLDFVAVDAVVDATHRYKEIFYGDD